MNFSASLVILVLYFTRTRGLSPEDQSSYGYHHPSTVNFNEIISNSLSMRNDDSLTTFNKDEEFHINNLPSRFVEFQPVTETTTTPTTTTSVTTPKPRFPPAKYFQTSSTTVHNIFTIASTTTTTEYTTSTTEKPDERTIKVLPLENRGRGVLDLLFPASRVKGFKNVFETFRRMLSSTF